MDDAERIAAKLTKAQQEAWIGTVLMVLATQPQRRAFAAGYNGFTLADFPRVSPEMRRAHQLGLRVRTILEKQHATD